MSILVLGLGVTGRAVAGHFLSLGERVYGLDDKKNTEDIPGLVLVKEVPVDTRLIVVSPGIAPDHPALQQGIAVTGEAELALGCLKDRDWIGITGTNGKTTVTLFMEHLFKEAGILSAALGNVGTPLLSHISPPGEVIIAELSSYQLETMKTRGLKAAVLLNITPDHLDRYGTMASYAAAKARIADCIEPKGELIIHHKTYQEWRHLFKDKLVTTYGFEAGADLCYEGGDLFYKGKKELSLGLPPTHDVENWMAAYLLGKVWGIGESVFLKALLTFEKPHHRIEKIAVFKDIHFFDDSKGTNIDATIRAVESMKGPVVLIAGGVHKGFSYRSWQEAFQGRVKGICVIGESAPLIEKDLQESFSVVRCVSMEEAVKRAATWAKAEECVLLSPGCASFDMFKDYAHRGEEFKRCVQNLSKDES